MQQKSSVITLSMLKSGLETKRKFWGLVGRKGGNSYPLLGNLYETYSIVLRVQVHESYQFEAKTYHSVQYHFRSIKTWLAGECRR